MPIDAAALVARAAAGERLALSRSISAIEARLPGIGEALASHNVRRRAGPGAPHVIGLTGPPGAGKSTFADRIVAMARKEDKRVAVVAVDPSSPFSGGAILGDRVRMEAHTGDDGVYVRSLSARGHLGGLSGATQEVVDILDVAGFDLIVVETVGVGQSELGVMEVADSVVVVLTPESGDTVQTLKAGLLEIADVFVINKADRPGAQRLAREMERTISLDGSPGYKPPVFTASATQRLGIDAVVHAAADHLRWCKDEGRGTWERRRGDARVRLYLDLIAERARAAADAALGPIDRERLRNGDVQAQTLQQERM
ncbi:MAG: LAO/AO transport system kinase [Myxococcota bacterium]|jgi:LAO/AO transport system kinase